MNSLSESVLPKWRYYLAAATVATMPFAINLERIKGQMKKRTYVSPFDALLPILLLLLLIDLAQKKPWAKFRIPPIPGMIWGLAALHAVFFSHAQGDTSFTSAILACRGLVVFGVLAVWVFQNCVSTAEEFRKLALTLLASFGVCLLMALMQYVGKEGLPFDPHDATKNLGGTSNIRLAGWYDFRNTFGAQVAMLAPAAVAFALNDRDIVVRCICGAGALIALCVTLSGGGFIAACAGILAVCAASSARAGGKIGWVRAAVGALALIVLVQAVLPNLPRKNIAVLSRSLTLYSDVNGEKKPTPRLRHYQASLDLLTGHSNPENPNSPPNWRAGVGPGRFQVAVNAYYDPIAYPKPSRATDDEEAFDIEADEPSSWGLYESTAVELGIFGMIAIALVFGCWIAGAKNVFSRTNSTVALAAFGAGCGAIVVSLFTNPAVQGIGGTMAFFLAIAFGAGSDAES